MKSIFFSLLLLSTVAHAQVPKLKCQDPGSFKQQITELKAQVLCSSSHPEMLQMCNSLYEKVGVATAGAAAAGLSANYLVTRQINCAPKVSFNFLLPEAEAAVPICHLNSPQKVAQEVLKERDQVLLAVENEIAEQQKAAKARLAALLAKATPDEKKAIEAILESHNFARHEGPTNIYGKLENMKLSAAIKAEADVVSHLRGKYFQMATERGAIKATLPRLLTPAYANTQALDKLMQRFSLISSSRVHDMISLTHNFKLSTQRMANQGFSQLAKLSAGHAAKGLGFLAMGATKVMAMPVAAAASINPAGGCSPRPAEGQQYVNIVMVDGKCTNVPNSSQMIDLLGLDTESIGQMANSNPDVCVALNKFADSMLHRHFYNFSCTSAGLKLTGKNSMPNVDVERLDSGGLKMTTQSSDPGMNCMTVHLESDFAIQSVDIPPRVLGGRKSCDLAGQKPLASHDAAALERIETMTGGDQNVITVTSMANGLRKSLIEGNGCCQGTGIECETCRLYGLPCGGSGTGRGEGGSTTFTQ